MMETTYLSDAKRKLLESYRRGWVGATASLLAPIAPRPLDEPTLVSLSQEQLLLREQRNQESPALYNECIRLRMSGLLDVVALQKSIREMIRRHEIWRTTYAINHGQWVRVVQPPPANVELPVVDLRGRPEAEVDEEVRRIAGEAVRQRFDLGKGPLWRVRMFRTADSEYSLFLSAHLSIVDGVSVYQILPSELSALYRAYSAGQASPLPDLEAQFGDYASWQRHWLTCGEAEKQLGYWRKQLDGPLPVLAWPKKQARAATDTLHGEIGSFIVKHELMEAMEGLSRQEGVSLFMALLAALVSLLHLYAGQDDILVGTPSLAGRKRSEVQSLLGYFLNPVALRFDLTEGPTFRTLLRQVQRVTLEALSNDDVPLEVLAQKLELQPTRGRNPFFSVAMSLQPQMAETGLEWSVTSMDIGSGGSPWDLYLAFINRSTESIARVQYNPELFESETIARLIGDYQTLLRAVTDNPTVRVSQININAARD